MNGVDELFIGICFIVLFLICFIVLFLIEFSMSDVNLNIKIVLLWQHVHQYFTCTYQAGGACFKK